MGRLQSLQQNKKNYRDANGTAFSYFAWPRFAAFA
jgi:hypothetical protein